MAQSRRSAAAGITWLVMAIIIAGCALPGRREPPDAAATTQAMRAASVPLTVDASRAPAGSGSPTALPIASTPPTAAAATMPADDTPLPSPVAMREPDGEVDAVKLIIVYDNNPYEPGLNTGWGLSAWLKYGDHTILFDTGASGGALLENLARLALDPMDIDIVVLSHDHGDHTGGLGALLGVNSGITLYLPQAFPASFKEHARAAGATVVDVDRPAEIVRGVWSTGGMGSGIVEQALVAETEQGLVVLTGCAHPGVDEMVARGAEIAGGERAGDKIAMVVGGFHLGGAGRGRVEEIIGAFRRLGVRQVAPCHCTGDVARALFQEAYGDDYIACGAGWHWQNDVPAWRPAHQGIPAQVGVADTAVAPSDPRVIYLAAYAPGGVYRSDDGGDLWRMAGHGLQGFAPLTIALHPRDADRAWVATASGLYLTADGGQSWRPAVGVPDVPIYAIVAAADGQTVYAGGEEAGVWRSEDGGETWAPAGVPGAGLSTLSLAAGPAGRLFAGTAGQGVWVSHDRGDAWQPAGQELGASYVTDLSVTADGRLYALADGQLYTSTDSGEMWQGIGPPEFAALSLGVAGGPRHGELLYLGSDGAGVVMSEDGGQSWRHTGSEFRHAAITCLVADPAAPERLFLGTRVHGLYRSEDGGATWTLVTGGIGEPVITDLAQDAAGGEVFYAGALDGVYRSRDGGEHWQLVTREMGKLPIQALAVSPERERVYAGTDRGIYLSQDGGVTWWEAEDTRGIAVFALVVDPHDSARIYAGTWGHNVLRSMDGGRTWTPIHHGLETLSVHAFAVDPDDPDRLYAGTVEAVYRSTDGGKTWEMSPLAGRALTTFALLVERSAPGRVYAGTTAGVYRSIGDGVTWEPMGHESLGVTVTALAPLPGGPGALLAGTEHHGLYLSGDGGATWRPWGVAGASVYAVLVDRGGTVWLGTDRGIFTDR